MFEKLIDLLDRANDGCDYYDALIYQYLHGGTVEQLQSGEYVVKAEDGDWIITSRSFWPTKDMNSAFKFMYDTLKICSLTLIDDPSGTSADITYWPNGLSEKYYMAKGMSWTPELSICAAVIRVIHASSVVIEEAQEEAKNDS